MTFTSHSPHETQRIAKQFAKKLKGGVWVGLFGELGVGKTTFIQGMARGLGINPATYVTSPTFTIVNEYGKLIHVDLYRVESPVEVDRLGLEDYSDRIVVIEWAEKLASHFDYRVTITETRPEGPLKGGPDPALPVGGATRAPLERTIEIL